MTNTHFAQLAYGFLILALLSVLGGSASYVGAYRFRNTDREEGFLEWGRHGFRFAALTTVLASIYLLFFFVNKHFEVDYVFHNSSRDLPLIFRISSFWAGQEGSFLLWGLWTGIIGVILIRKVGKVESSVMPFYGLTYAFILTMVACINPFRTSTTPRPDGMGLNPLLQDYWMAIHPPTLFLGYTLMAVPFAYAMGALVRKDYKDWIRAAAPWTILAATVLATALSMGGHWAYRTLGWGGFWGWDPVENASFVPMLVGIALIHGLFLQRGSNAAAQRGNIGLAITGFAAVMYASYLTRSGVLSQFSNHSFSELPHGWFLLASLIFFVVMGYGTFLYRYKSIPSQQAYEAVTGREFGFYLSIVVLMIAAVVVAFGTSTPIITGYMGKARTVGQDFYNWTMAPLGFLMALMLCIYPITARNGIAKDKLIRKLAGPVITGLVLAAAVGIFSAGHLHGGRMAAAVGLVFGGTVAFLLNLSVILRMARNGGLVPLGGYLAHVGFGVLLLGIVCSAIYSSTERIMVFKDGEVPPMMAAQAKDAFGYHFVLKNNGEQVTDTRTAIPLVVTPNGQTAKSVWGKMADAIGHPAFEVRPSMAQDRNGNQMTAPGIYSHPLYDLYVAPVEFDPGSYPSMPITIKRGEIYTFGPLKIFFAGVTEEGTQGSPDWAVRANLLVLRGNQHVPIEPELNLTNQRGTIVVMPGGSRINIDPDTGFNGALTFDLTGPNAKRMPPMAVMDVTVKPLISLTWIGMILTVLGGLLAVVRRTKDNRRRQAELMDEEEPKVAVPGQEAAA